MYVVSFDLPIAGRWLVEAFDCLCTARIWSLKMSVVRKITDNDARSQGLTRGGRDGGFRQSAKAFEAMENLKCFDRPWSMGMTIILHASLGVGSN